jgi:hypothetical protein
MKRKALFLVKEITKWHGPGNIQACLEWKIKSSFVELKGHMIINLFLFL